MHIFHFSTEVSLDGFNLILNVNYFEICKTRVQALQGEVLDLDPITSGGA